jgi:ABC-type transporter Mla maintaining outer membrane lipid asymmetry permease subunit MlaE
MAFFTFWKIGIITAAVLLAAAIATGIQALMGSCQTKDGDN